MFSGDVLFAGSIGRIDLPGGSMAQMTDSLRGSSAAARRDVVQPGHGPSTTIGRERVDQPVPAGARVSSEAHAAVGLPRIAAGPAVRRAGRASTRCATTFELHGFAPIETRAVEPLDQLLRKGEIDKEIYVAAPAAAADDDGRLRASACTST